MLQALTCFLTSRCAYSLLVLRFYRIDLLVLTQFLLRAIPIYTNDPFCRHLLFYFLCQNLRVWRIVNNEKCVPLNV